MWSFTTNESAPTWYIRTMVHTYLAMETVVTAELGMITVGWPLWVEAADNTASPVITNNDGAEVWNVVKFYLTATTSTAAWVGTFLPTG